MGTLRMMVAVVFIMHGLGHAMGFMESWLWVSAGWNNNPWIFSGAVTIQSNIGKVFGLIWLAALVAFVIAGYGLLTQQLWWRPWALTGAIISLVAIVPWWNTVVAGARIGGTLVDVVTLVGLLLMAERVTQWLG